jgi:hypothetical protein
MQQYVVAQWIPYERKQKEALWLKRFLDASCR